MVKNENTSELKWICKCNVYQSRNSWLAIHDKIEKFVALSTRSWLLLQQNMKIWRLLFTSINKKQLKVSYRGDYRMFTCKSNLSFLVAWAKDNKIIKVYFSSASCICMRKI